MQTEQERSNIIRTIPIEGIELLIGKVVNRFLYNKHIPKKEQEDFRQELIHKYLLKQEKIEHSFKGDSKYETYLTSVFYKMGCEIIRSEKKNWNLYEDEQLPLTTQNETNPFRNDRLLVIQAEIDYLYKIIELFDDEKMKVIIFHKHFYQISILMDELAQYHPEYKKLNIDKILLRIASSKQDAFANLAQVVNIVEGKNIKPDAVRIWLYNKTDRMISILNNTYQRSGYDRKSFQILFEYAYVKK